MNIRKLARTTPASRAQIAARRAAGVGKTMVAGHRLSDSPKLKQVTRAS
jgi:hypothetical protein